MKFYEQLSRTTTKPDGSFNMLGHRTRKASADSHSENTTIFQWGTVNLGEKI